MSKYCDDALNEVYSYLDRELSDVYCLEGSPPPQGLRWLRGCVRLRGEAQGRDPAPLREEPPPEFLARLREAIDHERWQPLEPDLGSRESNG